VRSNCGLAAAPRTRPSGSWPERPSCVDSSATCWATSSAPQRSSPDSTLSDAHAAASAVHPSTNKPTHSEAAGRVDLADRTRPPRPGRDPMMWSLRDPFVGAGLRGVCQACVKQTGAGAHTSGPGFESHTCRRIAVPEKRRRVTRFQEFKREYARASDGPRPSVWATIDNRLTTAEASADAEWTNLARGLRVRDESAHAGVVGRRLRRRRRSGRVRRKRSDITAEIRSGAARRHLRAELPGWPSGGSGPPI
jgi:hypothetical protein